jgi:small-conductance mechanosensitive channel
VLSSKKPNDRQFRVGDKIRVNLHHGRIEDAVVKAIIDHSDGLKLQIDFGHEQTPLIDLWQVVE